MVKNQGNMRKPEERLCCRSQRTRESWEEIFGDLKEERAEKEPLAARMKTVLAKENFTFLPCVSTS